MGFAPKVSRTPNPIVPVSVLCVDAAIVVNMWRVGELSQEEFKEELPKLYPEDAEAWIEKFSAIPVMG